MADHWDDVLSDWSAIHRKDPVDIASLSTQEFWPRTLRLLHYQGAVRDLVLHKRVETGAPAAEASASPQPTATATELIDPTPEQIKSLRAAARRKRFPADRYGEVNMVTENEIVREASGRA